MALESSQYETSFRDVALRLWARRGIIGALALLAFLGGGAWAAFALISGTRDLVYYIDLKGIEKGKYPGGASFSPYDLQSPEVLQAAIQAVGVSLDKMQEIEDGLRIELGSPEVAGIVQKYRERLAARNLSATEIDARNAEFKSELEAVTASSVRLVLDPAAAGLGSGTAKRLLQEIPSQWTGIYAERYRIFEATGLEGTTVSKGGGPLDDPRAAIAALRVLKTVAERLEAMAGDNRVSYVVNSSGHSPAEVLELLEVFRSVHFRPLIRSVLGRPDPVADSYRLDLELRSRYLKSQIASYSLIADEISQGREGSAAEWAENSDAPSVNQLQISGDSLATIIELAERASSAEFLREVLLDRHDLTTELADTEIELARLETPINFEVSAQYVEDAGRNFDSLVDEFGDLQKIAINRLRADLGTLYTVSASPTRDQEVALSRIAVRAAGFFLAALFIGAVAAFILPAPRP